VAAAAAAAEEAAVVAEAAAVEAEGAGDNTATIRTQLCVTTASVVSVVVI